MPTPRRRAFTLLELLITITIIMVLVSMMFVVMRMLQRQKNKVMTRSMMNQISLALTDYLGTYPLLGIAADATSSDFVDSPWTFLGRNRIAAGKVPYLDLLAKFLATGPAAGPWGAATQANGDQLLDTYTAADRSNHFVWAIINQQTGGNGPFTYTDEIWIRSTAGTPNDVSDDLIMHLTTKDGQWTSLNYAQAQKISTLPLSFGLGPYVP
jgi:type II secretory pathway pseudopilin PulG